MNQSRPDSPIATATPENSDSLAGGADGALDGLLDGPAARQLLAESAGQEERVVDRQRQPEHRRDVEHVDAHLGLLGDEPDRAPREVGIARPATSSGMPAATSEREDEDQDERGDRQRDRLGAEQVRLGQALRISWTGPKPVSATV